MIHQKKYSVGVVGTGFIARGLIQAVGYDPALKISKVLTRRNKSDVKDIPLKSSQLTHSLQAVIRNSDIVVEATGDVLYGTEIVEHVLLAGKPVVTMNAELQLTTGTMLSKLGTLIESEGDQPGTLAALHNEMTQMGFKPLVYGNIKGFMNHTPTLKDMEYWAEKQGIRIDKVTAFTDGTKVEIEQALVANGLGAQILNGGMAAHTSNSHEEGALYLGKLALKENKIISDYVITNNGPAGVFIVATHANEQSPYLEYLKLGKGPLYTITRPYHLCHLEIPKTIHAVLTNSRNYTFNNGTVPSLQVYPIAKMDLKAGEKITKGIGSFKIRGKAASISENRGLVPIGLMDGATLSKDIQAGEKISFEDVTLPESRALDLWKAYLFENYQIKNIVSRQQRLQRKNFIRNANTKGTWYNFLRHTKTSFKTNDESAKGSL